MFLIHFQKYIYLHTQLTFLHPYSCLGTEYDVLSQTFLLVSQFYVLVLICDLFTDIQLIFHDCIDGTSSLSWTEWITLYSSTERKRFFLLFSECPAECPISLRWSNRNYSNSPGHRTISAPEDFILSVRKHHRNNTYLNALYGSLKQCFSITVPRHTNVPWEMVRYAVGIYSFSRI